MPTAPDTPDPALAYHAVVTATEPPARPETRA